MKNHVKLLKSALFLSAIATLLNLTGCKSSSRVRSSELEALETNNIDTLKRSLGSGYDSSRNIKLSPCIEPSQFVYSGSNFSNLAYLRDFTFDELAEETGVDAYGKANLFGLIKGKISGQVTTSLAKTDESSSFIYKFDVVGKSAVLKNPVLNAKGLAAFKKNDLLQFRKECGDQFVDQVKLGAQLFIGVKYTFTSAEDKEALHIKLKVSALWGLIKYSKTWNKEQRELLKNLRIKVEAYQLGGDPSKLAALQASLLNLNCGGVDIEKCANGLDQLLKYASEDFSKQLKNLDITNNPNVGAAIIGVSTVPYNNQAFFDQVTNQVMTVAVTPDTTVDSAFKEAIARLNRLQSMLGIELNRTITLLDFNLTPTERATVLFDKRNLESLIASGTVIMKQTCILAKKKVALREVCAAKVGAIELTSAKALNPTKLLPR